MAISPSLTYTPCAKCLRKQTSNIITFTQFEEGGLLSETSDDAEIGDKSDDDSIMPPLISKETLYTMDSCNESEDEPMSRVMSEETCHMTPQV